MCLLDGRRRLRKQLPEQVGEIAATAAAKEDICWKVLSSLSDKELDEVCLCVCVHMRACIRNHKVGNHACTWQSRLLVHVHLCKTLVICT